MADETNAEMHDDNGTSEVDQINDNFNDNCSMASQVAFSTEEQGGTVSAVNQNSTSRNSIKTLDEKAAEKADEQMDTEKESVLKRNYQSWTSYMPSLNIIRNHVINPLLVATEKVVEQYIPVIANPEE